jgi:hypothetical protein
MFYSLTPLAVTECLYLSGTEAAENREHCIILLSL